MVRQLTAAGIILACAVLWPGASSPRNIVDERRDSGRDAVERRRAADRERIEKIRKKLRAFMDEINGRLGRDGGTRIDDPVDPDRIEEITDIDHFHSRKKIPVPRYAFAKAEGVVLRSEPASSAAAIVRLAAGERVELLARTAKPERIDGSEAPWFLARRSGGDEGWVFGAFLRATDDEKRDEDAERLMKLDLPVPGRISGKFGYRVDPVTRRKGSFHRGIDIAAPEGTPVKAAAAGTVVKAGYFPNGYGNLVVLEHEKGVTTYYGHLSRIDAATGARVARGDLIGAVGKTGRATGPHLHFEVRRGDTAYDPEAWLR